MSEDVVDEAAETEVDAPEAGTDGDAAAEWKPPTKAEWDAIQTRLKREAEQRKKANAEAASHRKQADEARRQGETDAEAKIREAREEAQREVVGKYKPKLLAKALEGAAAKSGFTGSTDYLVRLLGGAEAIELDDDLEVTDLDDRLKSLKKDLPGLFTKTTPGRIDGSDRPGSPALTNDEQRRKKMLADAGFPV